jgi:hypothetical protein
MRPVLLLLAIATVAGCTAVKATYHVSVADQAIREARSYDAATQATYEYTMALRYLEASKENLGFSQYKDCEQYARKSAEWADKAIITVQNGKRVNGSLDLSNDAPPPAAPVPIDQPLPPPPPVQLDQWGIPIVTPDSAQPPAPAPPPPPPPAPAPAPKDDYGNLENGDDGE